MKISGKISKIEYSHDNFYSAIISSNRTSGSVDELPLIIPDYLIRYVDEKNMVIGEIRSRNVNRHLQLYIFVSDIEEYSDDQDINIVLLSGTLCKDATQRETPKGRIITDMVVATHRQYKKSDYIPCIAFGENNTGKTGEKIIIEGRFQSREYAPGKTAYEVAISACKYPDRG